MSNRKIIFISFIFLAMITSIRLFWINLFSMPNQPYAVQGMLDLRDWESITDHSLSLDGEWEFYPNVLLMDTDISKTKENELIQVPSNWNFSNSNESASTYGFGSYRLRILVDPDKGKTYGLHIQNISISSEVYVNGELLLQSGKPAHSKQQYNPLNAPNKAYFTIDEQSEIELIIHVANYDHPLSGGIVQSVKLGLVEPFNKDTNISTNIVIVACVIYMFHAVYAVILFLAGNFNRRLLYFSLMIVCIVLGTLIGERLLFAWFPFTYDWSVKITYLTMIAGGYFLYQVIRMSLTEVLRTKLFTLYSIVSGLLTIVVLFVPPSYIFSMQLLISIFMLIPCLLLILVMYRATVKIDKDNIFLLLAGIAAIGSLIWLIIIIINQIEMVSYPFDLIIATICFSIYWFKQYFKMIDESQRMTAKLQEEDKRKDEFLVNVAHEMRNPLHGILNISQSILEREKRFLRKKSIQDLELVHSIGRHMQLLLNDLLDLSKVKDNRMLIKPTNVSIQSVVETVFEMLQYAIEGKQIQLIHRIPKNFPLVLADENRLIQIVFNLIHNAIKYSNAGDVSVHASIQGKWAKISVVDTGIGMDNEFLKKVFEPYERATSSQTLSSGLGIGLSVCKQLVESHGGTLNVTSRLNEGSEFSFTLKLAASDSHLERVQMSKMERERSEQRTTAKVTEGASIPDAKKISSQPIKILAVDDDPINLEVLKSIFSMEPYEVNTVTSGEEALSLIHKEIGI